MEHPGRVFVISGASGTGKTSLVHWLLEHAQGLELSLSTTTREPRKNEHNGEQYNFVDREQFERMLHNGELLEHTELYGNFYGTSRSDLERIRARGVDVLFEIDGIGAVQIKGALPEARLIFIVPPSMETLRQRLEQRGTDSDEVIQRRLANARREMSYLGSSEFVVINDEFDAAARDLLSIVNYIRGGDAQRADECRLERSLSRLDPQIAAGAGFNR
ncbi:MAG: guanylate kinase [Candidatus Alcyoniella australis]|nr:guanylate kinase [Candidatus Alcyoniella australis]